MRQATLFFACLALSCSNSMDMSATEPDSQLKNGTRLRNKLINAEDGTIAMGTGLTDTQLNIDCAFALAEDGTMRCLPFGAFLQYTYFLDNQCMQTFAYSSTCSPPVKYIADYSTNSCGKNRVLGLVPIDAPPANVYYKNGANCVSIANGYSTYRMYSLGAAVSASMFVAGMAAN